jgi:hypothetical protein
MLIEAVRLEREMNHNLQVVPILLVQVRACGHLSDFSQVLP